MLDTFAKHLALIRNAWSTWGGRALGLSEAMTPAKLAEMVVFSFLEDAWLTLTSTVLPMELRGVGNIRRIEEGRIHFCPDPCLQYEIDTKQFLLDGLFWRVLCRVDTREEVFCVPPRSTEGRVYSTARLREVGELMLMVGQRHNTFFCDILPETLWSGLCLAIHDSICGGTGFYLEKIGTFFPNGHFEPDRLLLAKIRENNADVLKEDPDLSFPESRRRNNNQAWYWKSDG